MKLNSLVNCKYKNYAILFVLALGFVNSIRAQSTTVGGTVTGEDGNPLLGVTIVVKGTSNGTVSDFDGIYQITANTGDVLVFSSIGFENQEAVVESNKLNITMVESVSTLERVVVVGYGSQKRIEVSGAVSSVKGEEVQKFASNNFQEALQGKVAGVTVLAAGGEPGSGAIIQIRGTNTLGSSRSGRRGDPNLNLLSPTEDGLSPLYIVDGVQLETNPNISSNDIESIEILKDAATTSIYGSRGAAGVIIITTKKGQSGKAKIEFKTFTGFKKITSRINLINTEEALFIDRIIHENNAPNLRYFSPLDRNKEAFDFNTNWERFVLNDFAPLTNSNLRVSGGNKDINYNVSLDHYEEDGVFKTSDLQRTNLRTNASIKKGKFSARIITGASTGERDLAPWGLLYDAFRLSPFSRPFQIGNPNIETPSGEVQPDGTIFLSTNNVSSNLARKFSTDAKRKEFNFSGNISLTYKILDPLKLRANISGFRSMTESVFYNPVQTVRSSDTGVIIPNQSRPASVTNSNTVYQTFNRDAQLDYDQYFGKNRLALLLGAEARETLWRSFRISGNTFLSPEQRTISGAEVITQRTLFEAPGITNSYFSRLKYEYDNKYFLLGNIRRNGSSKFPTVNQIGWFGGVSGAWVVSNEGFIKNSQALSFISNLKFRASWGTVGNDRIGDFTFISTALTNANPVFQGGTEFGASRGTIGNKDLKWETTINTNYGLDLGFLQGAITFTGDYFVAKKSDLLYRLPTRLSTGVVGRPIALNIAELTNTGLELAANYRDNKGAFKWSVGATFTKIKNVVDKLSTDTDVVGLGFPLTSTNNVVQTPVTFLRPGYSAGAFFLIPTNGTIKNEAELEEYNNLVSNRLGNRSNKIGDLRYVDRITEDLLRPMLDANGNPVLDANGDTVLIEGQDGVLDSGNGVIDENDRVFMGNNVPDFETAINFNASYKNFDFSMSWFGMFGHKVFNGPRNVTYAFGTNKESAYQWSPLNPTSNIPSRRPNGTQDVNYSSASDLFLEDGDFVRLRNLQVGYTLPKDTFEAIGLNKLRIYLSGQNLLTITDYSGYDPEIGGDGLATRSIDTGTQPVTAQLILGLQVTF